MFKGHKIKDHSDMFQIVCDPSSGSVELYLTEIRSVSLMFVVCLIGIWQRNFEPLVYVCVCVRYDGLTTSSHSAVPYTYTPLVQNYAAKHRSNTRQTSVNHYEFQSSTALYSLMMDRIRSETCQNDF